MHFRKAIQADADVFPELEQSAGLLFRADAELAWLADADNLPAESYREIIAEGWSWVAEDKQTHPVAFLAATREGEELHIWELNVGIDYQRRGIGRELLEHLMTEAAAAKVPAITLTTFRDLAWNAPFYHSMGFELVPPEKLCARLTGLLDDEIRRGMPAERRCAMRKTMS